MRNKIQISFIIFLIISANTAFAAQPEYKSGELLVRFAEVNGQVPDSATKISILNSLIPGSTIETEYTIVSGLVHVKLPSSINTTIAETIISQSSDISYAGKNYKYHPAAIPSDTRFSELWAMNNTGQGGGTTDADIDAVEAWNIETGSSSIIVAVTDTGIDVNHPDLVGNLWLNFAEISGIDNYDDDDNGYIDDKYGY